MIAPYLRVKRSCLVTCIHLLFVWSAFTRLTEAWYHRADHVTRIQAFDYFCTFLICFVFTLIDGDEEEMTVFPSMWYV